MLRFMKLLLLFFTCLIIINSSLVDTYETKYIEVPLDHFSYATNLTFKLKYLVNDTFWEQGGPIFFYTGNEGAIEVFYNNTGFIFEIAPTFRAKIVFAEHRYYGESLPFGNISLKDPEHSGYLTSEQALADFVYLLDEINEDNQLPVIAFGGSYGGMLASWMRIKYPASVVGAIAASAPILQFTGLTPCESFNNIVTSVYQTVLEKDCSEPIRNSWKAMRTMGQTEEGRAWLTRNWTMCDNLTSEKDIDKLVEDVEEIIVNLAMINYPYPTDFIAPVPGHPVREFCIKLLETGYTNDQELLFNLGKAIQVFTNYTQTTKCFQSGSSDGAIDGNGWSFQACTEMIMPMCSVDEDMFENTPWNFTTYADECFKDWGIRPSKPNVAVLEYGGRNLKSASNIVFSNGLLDPWSGGGVLSNISETVSAILIPDGAHHLDLRSSNKLDPESVINARMFHVDSIKRWIEIFYLDRNSIPKVIMT